MSKKQRKEQVILVTGGAGYIGSRLIRDLASDSRFPSCIIRIYDNLQRHHLCGLMDLPSKHRYEFIEGDILDRMNRAIDAAIKSPELRARLIPQGIDPVGGTRAEFVKFINAEKARLAPIAKASNMRED